MRQQDGCLSVGMMEKNEIQTQPFPFRDFERRLRHLNLETRPGLKAQLAMAPAIRIEEISRLGRGQRPKKSAVLLLFYPDSKQIPHLLMIRRTPYDGVHSGQVSFPGGRFEHSDHNLMDTALRETHEETGVKPQGTEVLGRLTDLYIPPSNYLVTPYVGIRDHTPSFTPDPSEVSGIIQVPVHEIFHPGSAATRPITLSGGQCMETPCYVFDNQVVWGATAMILSEFVRWFLSADPN